MGRKELYKEANQLLSSYFGVDCEYPILSHMQWRKRYQREYSSQDMDGFAEMKYRKDQGRNIRNLKPKNWLGMK